MGKRIQYTKITPLPSNVPRQLALELLHSHPEVIELNPLVTGVKAAEAPRDVSSDDEYFLQWYEITEIITWAGMKKRISFKGVFHNLPYGMQSHVYAPMGVDLRNKYMIGGNQPGEPREARELGANTPLDGLYLREDVEIVCNIALASFVKKETKAATGKMIQRLAKKAELLGEGRLHAMFENGRLKTAKPSFSDTESSLGFGSPHGSPSPSMPAAYHLQPQLDKNGYGNYHEMVRSQSNHRAGQYSPAYQQPGYNGPDDVRPSPELLSAYRSHQSMPMINELPGSHPLPQHSSGIYSDSPKPQGQSFCAELAGDSSFSVEISSRPPPPQELPGAEPAAQYQAYRPHNGPEPPERASTGEPFGARASELGKRGSQLGLGIQKWQQEVASRSTPSFHRNSIQRDTPSPYKQRSRLVSNTVPDPQLFSQTSTQKTSNQGYHTSLPLQARGSQSSAMSPPQRYARIGAKDVKCPICNLFEGDAAAVTHHVSKRHLA